MDEYLNQMKQMANKQVERTCNDPNCLDYRNIIQENR
jgi:hypothetical protein